MIGKVFPMNLKKQLACLYTNYFFTGLRITDAVWVALLAARGFSLWEWLRRYLQTTCSW